MGGLHFDGTRELWRPQGALRQTKGDSVQLFGNAGEIARERFNAASPVALRWRGEPTRDRYERHVHDAVTAIGEGALEKVVLARTMVSDSEHRLSVAGTARALGDAFPNATVYVMALASGEVLCGATPELIAHVDRGVLRTQAVAGTGTSDALLESDKDRHEHELVVADITRSLAAIGIDAMAASAPQVVPSGELAHLVTPIEARLPDGVGVLEVVERLHPTAALCGTPRDRARAWIGDHEGFDRGWYGGPIGWADDRGNGTFVVALRCALISADRRSVRCFAGAGIVAGSDPQLEAEETAAKMRAAQGCLRAEVAS